MFGSIQNMLLDYLSCFTLIETGDTQERWYMLNWFFYSLQIRIFPLSWSHKWKYNTQVNKTLNKVKEKWSAIQFGILFLHFHHSNFPDNKCHKQCMLCFTCIRLVACVLACAHASNGWDWYMQLNLKGN